jgi:2-dehydro-3-deoxyphosphogluconate aldolase / (4S)-4-hydroxy-2-oxoglutarate aldolase
MDDVLAIIETYRLVPMIALDRAADAVPLGEAFLAGGLPIAEVTFRTDAAAEAISQMASLEGLLVGAGTVLTAEQVDQAVDAGARFIVSPGTTPAVVERCLHHGVAVMPGVCTPSDIERAMGYGLEVLKFFPAGAFGGPATLKAVSAPYRQVRFIPTGGVSLENVASYLSLGCVLACGGSWLAKREVIDAGRFEEITETVRKSLAVISDL